VAADIDPERLRRLKELGALHDRWQQQYQIDDAEWTVGGADDPERRRPPSREAEWEFVTEARKIMGRDPETGRRRDPVLLPAARARDEALLYLDLRPCVQCEGIDIAWQTALGQTSQGLMVRRYYGNCGTCGRAREVHFQLPEHPLVPGPNDVVFFGGDEPSRLLDPGEWVRVAEISARSVPAGPAPDARARYSRAVAVAAINETLKFIPPGARAVPKSAFWTMIGQDLYAQEPGRFNRDRLETLRDSYAGTNP
jgi:hypothetical protein